MNNEQQWDLYWKKSASNSLLNYIKTKRKEISTIQSRSILSQKYTE